MMDKYCLLSVIFHVLQLNHFLHLIMCNYLKNQCNSSCKSLANNLPCAEMCECEWNDERFSNDTKITAEIIECDSEDELIDT